MRAFMFPRNPSKQIMMTQTMMMRMYEDDGQEREYQAKGCGAIPKL
jgi:hypothetical protein